MDGLGNNSNKGVDLPMGWAAVFPIVIPFLAWFSIIVHQWTTLLDHEAVLDVVYI